MRAVSRLKTILVTVLTSLLLVSVSFGQDRTYQRELELSVAHIESDNPGRRVNADAIEGSFDSLGLVFNYMRTGPIAQINLNSDLEYLKFSEEALGDQTVGNLNFVSQFDLVEDRFNWKVEDHFGQFRTDPFGVDSPLNRQGFNVFLTGPELTLPLAPRTETVFSVTGGTATYQDFEDSDNDFVDAEVGVFNQLGQSTLLGISLQEIDFSFDDPMDDYAIERLQLSVDRELPRGVLSIRFGESTLKFADTKTSDNTFYISWLRRLGARSSLTLIAERDFSDATGAFALSSARPSIGEPTIGLQTADPILMDRVGTVFSLLFPRTTVSIGAGIFEQEFELDPTFDNESIDALISIRRLLTSRTGISMQYDRVDRDFFMVNNEYDEQRIRLSVDHRFGEHFIIEGHIEANEREGTDPFEERLYEVRLTYVLGGN